MILQEKYLIMLGEMKVEISTQNWRDILKGF